MADIITPPIIPTSTTPPSKADKVAFRLAMAQECAQRIANQIVALRERGFAAIWDQSDPEVTPADMFAALGAAGIAACQRDADTVAFCAKEFPSVALSPVPAGWTLAYDPTTGIVTAAKV